MHYWILTSQHVTTSTHKTCHINWFWIHNSTSDMEYYFMPYYESYLTTESVILALSCLIPRTGYDRVITTDNSTKIVGSESKLRESINNLINLKVTLHLNTKNISLNLNPPPSTWMLGSWESIMKSVTRG